jgi:hypothetical protein
MTSFAIDSYISNMLIPFSLDLFAILPRLMTSFPYLSCKVSFNTFTTKQQREPFLISWTDLVAAQPYQPAESSTQSWQPRKHIHTTVQNTLIAYILHTNCNKVGSTNIISSKINWTRFLEEEVIWDKAEFAQYSTANKGNNTKRKCETNYRYISTLI